MTVLFGHPTGNPNSFHAALAHWERGRLEAFCLPWMPTPRQLRVMSAMPGVRRFVPRLSRRCFEPLLNAPRIEGKLGEWRRMAQRVARGNRPGGERLSYQANDWLMNTMSRNCQRPAVTAVHAYEDCSLWSFQHAKRLGKACIYDMPIGYYPAWEDTQTRLMREFADWMPADAPGPSPFVRPQQKIEEMALADVVLAASSFTLSTIQRFISKDVRVAPYGIDTDVWRPLGEPRPTGPLRFLYAGHISIRKGLPLLMQAWRRAALRDAVLDLVGSWQLADARKAELPPGVSYRGHCSPSELRQRYQTADVFVFPSYFEGYGLVLGEAMACGLPVLASDATAAVDMCDDSCGQVFPSGDLEALVDRLRFFDQNRDRLPEMKAAARRRAESLTWDAYRSKVSAAVEAYC